MERIQDKVHDSPTIQITQGEDNSIPDLATVTTEERVIQHCVNDLNDDVPSRECFEPPASQVTDNPTENSSNENTGPERSKRSLKNALREPEEMYACNNDTENRARNLELSLEQKTILLEKTELELLLEQTNQIQQRATMFLSQIDTHPNEVEKNRESHVRHNNVESNEAEIVPTVGSNGIYMQLEKDNSLLKSHEVKEMDLTNHNKDECATASQNGLADSLSRSHTDRSLLSDSEPSPASQKWQDNIQLLEENAELLQKKIQLEVLLQQAKLLLEKSQLLPAIFPLHDGDIANEAKSSLETSGFCIDNQALTLEKQESVKMKANYSEKPAQKTDLPNLLLSGSLSSKEIHVIQEAKELSLNLEFENEKTQISSKYFLSQNEPSEHNPAIHKEKIILSNKIAPMESQFETEASLKDKDTESLDESETTYDEKLQLQLLLQRAKLVLEKANVPLKSKYSTIGESTQDELLKVDQSVAQVLSDSSVERTTLEERRASEQSKVALEMVLREKNDLELKLLMTKAKLLQHKADMICLLKNRLDTEADIHEETTEQQTALEKDAETSLVGKERDSKKEHNSTIAVENLSSINTNTIKQIRATCDHEYNAELPQLSKEDEQGQELPEKEEEMESDEDDPSFDYKLELQLLLQKTKSLLEKTKLPNSEEQFPLEPEFVYQKAEFSTTFTKDSSCIRGANSENELLDNLEAPESTCYVPVSTNKSVIEVTLKETAESSHEAKFHAHTEISLLEQLETIKPAGQTTERTLNKIEGAIENNENLLKILSLKTEFHDDKPETTMSSVNAKIPVEIIQLHSNSSRIKSFDQNKQLVISNVGNELNKKVCSTGTDQNKNGDEHLTSSTQEIKDTQNKEIKHADTNNFVVENLQKTNVGLHLEQTAILNEKSELELLMENKKPLQQKTEIIHSGKAFLEKKFRQQSTDAFLPQDTIIKSCHDEFQAVLHMENVRHYTGMSQPGGVNCSFETETYFLEQEAVTEDQDSEDDIIQEIEAPLEIEESLSDSSELSNMIKYYEETESSEAEEPSFIDDTEESFDEKKKLQQILTQAQLLLEQTNQPIKTTESHSSKEVSTTEFEKGLHLDMNLHSHEKEMQASETNNPEVPSQKKKLTSEVLLSQATDLLQLLPPNLTETAKQSAEIQNTIGMNHNQESQQTIPLSEMSQQLSQLKSETTSFLDENTFHEPHNSYVTFSNDNFVKQENQTILKINEPPEVESNQPDLSVFHHSTTNYDSQRISLLPEIQVQAEALPDDKFKEHAATKLEAYDKKEKTSPLTSLTMLIKLQKEMAKMQLQMSNLQDAMRAANSILQELMEDALSDM